MSLDGPCMKSESHPLSLCLFVSYVHGVSFVVLQIKASWTIAFWNPGATDTGSILNEDGETVNEEKMALLEPIMYPDFR